MVVSQEEQDGIRQDYLESLQELTFNSGPIIKNLTVIAQENIEAAQGIVKAVEEHLSKCPPAYKLPALYLLDSICKNIGTPYTVYFGMDIFRLFTNVYTSVTEPIRRKMFELFRTWKENPSTHAPLFASDPMRKIENFLAKARLKQMELEQQHMQQQQQQINMSQPMMPLPMQPNMMPPMMAAPALSPASLVAEVDRLIDLTTQRKQLEPTDVDAQRQLEILNQLRMIIPTLSPRDLPTIQGQLVTFRQKEIEVINRKLASMPKQGPADLSQLLPFMPAQQNQQMHHVPVFNNIQPPTGPASTRSATGGPVLSMSLINSLQSAGLLGKNLGATFDVELTNASLMKPRIDLIDTLYKSIPNQCSTCGKRFKNDENGKKQRKAHLDWHFRVNKRLREDNRTQSRCWYLTLEEWAVFKDEDEILGWNAGDEDNGDKENNFKRSSQEGEKLTKESLEEIQKKYVLVPTDPRKAALPCPICREKFDKVWNDNAENWVWMNAIEDRGRICHATCAAEMKLSNNKKEESRKSMNNREKTSTPPIVAPKLVAGKKSSINDLLPPSIDLNAILANSKRKLEESTEPPLKREKV